MTEDAAKTDAADQLNEYISKKATQSSHEQADNEAILAMKKGGYETKDKYSSCLEACLKQAAREGINTPKITALAKEHGV